MYYQDMEYFAFIVRLIHLLILQVKIFFEIFKYTEMHKIPWTNLAPKVPSKPKYPQILLQI